MKKLIAVLIAAIMLAVFVAPGVAVAAKGGSGKTPPGQAKKAAPSEEGVTEESVKKGNKAEGFESPGQAKKGFDAEASEDASGTLERERTGVSNAISRIEANLFKAQDKILAGTKKVLPPGLLRVYAKFLGWLGLEPAEGLLLDDEGTEDGLEEDADGDEADDAEEDADDDAEEGDEGEGDETPDPDDAEEPAA